MFPAISSFLIIFFFALSARKIKHPQNKRPSEPIYAEPSKVTNPATATAAMTTIATIATNPITSSSSSSSSSNFHFQEYEGVTFRNPINKQITAQSSPKLDHHHQRKSDYPQAHYQIPGIITAAAAVGSVLTDDEKARHSDTELFGIEQPRVVATGGGGGGGGADTTNGGPARKYHAKSFSLSENRIAAVAAAGTNLFHQNRELWEKRAELQSQQCLTTPRILSRNRIAPDLVMDLPFQIVGVVATNSTGGGGGGSDGGNSSSRESLDSEFKNDEDLTVAERFAAANQCTLKKNERFSSDSYESNGGGGGGKKEVKLDFQRSTTTTTTTTTATVVDKPKAEVRPQETTADEVQLRIDEVDHHHHQQLHKSPIPARNTKKFVTQFADLHLTGGCMTGAESATTTVVPAAASQQTSLLSSFKPQVKVKPQLMKKPMVLPPSSGGTPEMSRRHPD